MILSPPQDTTIVAGQSLTFAAIANDSTGQNQINYIWDFGGAAPVSQQQSPGNFTFTQSGVYRVQFMVANAAGQFVGREVTRKITVRGQSNWPAAKRLGKPDT